MRFLNDCRPIVSIRPYRSQDRSSVILLRLNRGSMRIVALILGCALEISAFASDGGKVSLGDVAESAVRP